MLTPRPCNKPAQRISGEAEHRVGQPGGLPEMPLGTQVQLCSSLAKPRYPARGLPTRLPAEEPGAAGWEWGQAAARARAARLIKGQMPVRKEVRLSSKHNPTCPPAS